MTEDFDLVVIGAGPAGMAAADEASAHGVRVVVLDEQPEPGGQIYRNISTNQRNESRVNDILGADYRRGATLARQFVMACEDGRIDYRPDCTVWQVDRDRTVQMARGGRAEDLRSRRLIVATGAMERPVPIPGWTLPGVMSAGAAQIMLKAAQAVPRGPVVVAGTGPLLLLIAQQLVDAGATVAALLETTRAADYLAALPKLPAALRAPGYLRKGMAMRNRLRKAGVPIFSAVHDLSAIGGERVETVRFRRRGASHEIATSLLLLHQGVVPNVQITRQLGCEHAWDEAQRCWRPALDEWGNTSLDGIAVAGDGGGIAGAEAAALAGRIARRAHRRDRSRAPAGQARRGGARGAPAPRVEHPSRRPPAARCAVPPEPGDFESARCGDDSLPLRGGDGRRDPRRGVARRHRPEPGQGLSALRHGAVPGSALWPHRFGDHRRRHRQDGGRDRLLPHPPADQAGDARRAGGVRVRYRRSTATASTCADQGNWSIGKTRSTL
jgi:NADPH-dependent 2,4-dienoyl-CoA reductase/sulfur reductase-like enzyme